MTKQAIRMEICLGMQYKYRHFSQILRDTAWEIIILMKCFLKPEKIVRLLKDQIECKSEEAVNANVITKLWKTRWKFQFGYVRRILDNKRVYNFISVQRITRVLLGDAIISSKTPRVVIVRRRREATILKKFI